MENGNRQVKVVEVGPDRVEFHTPEKAVVTVQIPSADKAVGESGNIVEMAAPILKKLSAFLADRPDDAKASEPDNGRQRDARSDSERLEEQLDEGLRDSFPTSDPASAVVPSVLPKKTVE